MIYAIVGRPGGGKSYESVAFHVIPALKAGRKVVTNLTLKIEHFVKVFGEDVRDLIVIVDGQMTEFGNKERPFSKVEHYQDDWRNAEGQGPLFVVDEAHLPLGRQTNNEVLEWYSLHRHYGVDIVLMTQNLRKLNRDIKDMIEVTYQCTKATALGSQNSYVRKVRDGSAGDTVNTALRKYESAYFKFYQSHSKSNQAVKEASAQDIIPFWKRWPVVGTALFMVVGIGFNIWAWSGSEPDKVETKTQVTETKLQDEEPRKVSPKRGSGFGPLGSFDMFVTGHAKQIAYSSRTSATAELNRDLTFYRIYIDVYDGKRKVFSLNQLDLQNIGYTFEVLAECVYQVAWFDSSRVVTCQDEQVQPDSDSIMDQIPTFDAA